MHITKVAKIIFNSKSKMEKIEGINSEVSSVLNTNTGEIVFAILMKSFHFERALMEEHFNENYVESNKYPKATFKGKISNLASINFTKDGNYNAVVEGDMTIHGVTQKVKSNGNIIIKAGKINGISKFNIKLRDYKIEVPSLVKDKISEDVDIAVDAKYELKK